MKENTHCGILERKKATRISQNEAEANLRNRVAERIDRYCAGLSERENQ